MKSTQTFASFAQCVMAMHQMQLRNPGLTFWITATQTKQYSTVNNIFCEKKDHSSQVPTNIAYNAFMAKESSK
jgi:hypothetical protein